MNDKRSNTESWINKYRAVPLLYLRSKLFDAQISNDYRVPTSTSKIISYFVVGILYRKNLATKVELKTLKEATV